MLKLEVDGGSDLAGNEPVYSIQLHSVHPRAINTKDDVAYADLSGLVRRRPGNDLAYIDPAAGLLVPNRTSMFRKRCRVQDKGQRKTTTSQGDFHIPSQVLGGKTYHARRKPIPPFSVLTARTGDLERVYSPLTRVTELVLNEPDGAETVFTPVARME